MPRFSAFSIQPHTVAAALVGLLPLFSATAQATSSSAYGVEANFLWKKTKTGLGPVGPVSGAAPPAYSKTVTVGPFQKAVPLLPVATPVPTLSLSASAIKSHVASAGISIDTASAEGDTTVTGLDVTLATPPVVTGKTPIHPLLLQVTAKWVKQTTSFSQVFPQAATPNTSAIFSGLVVTGSLVNNQAIRFSGSVPNGTILFQSPTVTITLNSSVRAGLISCSPKCVFSLASVTGTALEIALTNADLNGETVSGEIVIGDAQAATGGLVTGPAEFPSEN